MTRAPGPGPRSGAVGGPTVRTARISRPIFRINFNRRVVATGAQRVQLIEQTVHALHLALQLIRIPLQVVEFDIPRHRFPIVAVLFKHGR